MPFRSYQAQSPEYKNWAQFQDKELQERRGNGYSPWEYMADLIPAGYNNFNVWLTERQNNDSYATGGEHQYATDKMRAVLEQMRGIADKDQKSPNRQRSLQERDAMSAWELMKTQGKVNY